MKSKMHQRCGGWLAVWLVAGALGVPQSRAEIYADLTLRHGETLLGTVRIDLHADSAPRPVANFIGLATGRFAWIHPQHQQMMVDTPYYDGTVFHRLVHDFVLQGGDPLGLGTGGPGYVFQDQFHPDLRHDRYQVSMAHSGAYSNGSQFFIVLAAATPWLDDLHSVFGEVNDPASRAIIDGFMDDTLFPTESSRPVTDIVLESVIIGGSGLASFDVFDPAHQLPFVKGVRSTLALDRPDPADAVVRLEWPGEYLHQYPIGLAADLMNRPPIDNFLLVMDEDGPVSEALPPVGAGGRQFAYVMAVDYSATVVAPVDVLAPGARLITGLHGGELAVLFGSGVAGDIGTWTYTGLDSAVASGTLAVASRGYYDDNLVHMPVFPDGQRWIFAEAGRVKYLAQRALYLQFNQPVGPKSVWNMEVELSFHAETAGWLVDDWYNSQPGHQPIRDPFTWTAPEGAGEQE
jgi:peptidyl-prolyl cis-trans isomerase A (cyclophilin A)